MIKGSEKYGLSPETAIVGNTLLPAVVYNDVELIKPINGQCYIVCNGGNNYHLAFWDDELGFINQIGQIPKEFKYWTELPIYNGR